MRKKDYDDDLLIELVADPQYTYDDIAKRVGLSKRMLLYIIRGEVRQDLHARLRAAILGMPPDQRRKVPAEIPTPSGRYDEEKLVELLSLGQLSLREIARKVGMSESGVRNIARGRRRRDLYERVQQNIEEIHERTHRRAVQAAPRLLERHIDVGMNEKGETARKCREYALNHVLAGRVDASKFRAKPALDLADVDLEELDALPGGPPADEGPYGPAAEEAAQAKGDYAPMTPSTGDDALA